MKHLGKINSPQDIKLLNQSELIELAEESRQAIVAAVAETGGHLSSSLGVVELTVALHYVFDTPRDKIIWDVSHQSYCHKLLTGRRDQIHTLRQYGGLSGFCRRDESEYDAFGAGHASTSISAALGFAAARDLKGEDYKVVAVIGDGAMTGGLAFEGLNNAGSLRKDLLVILNDNTWSISKNVGAISKYLTSIMADEKFNKLRREVWELTGRFKRRDAIRETVKRIENSIKNFLVPGMLFEKLGFRYFGPIDGHDLPLLVKTLQDISNLTGPIMLHVATIKGKGYAPSEEDAKTFHGVGKFNKVTGESSGISEGLPNYTEVFGKTMVELATGDDRVVAVTAAMCPGTGLDEFAEKFPDRFYDVGIAEAHAGTFAAGLAAEGMRPYFAVYSTFAQRALDQIIHDMAIQNLPVVLAIDRAGLVGNDGPTHHGAFDLAYLSTIPNVTVAVPKDGDELKAMLHHSCEHVINGVVAIRYPRDKVPSPVSDLVGQIEWGRWEWLSEPSDIVVLAVGSMIPQVQAAAEILSKQGINVSVVNARFVKPLDLVLLDQVLPDARVIVTVEEGALRGGFGQAVAEYLLSHRYADRFRAFGLPDRFVTHGSRAQLLKELGLDGESLAREIGALAGETVITNEPRPGGGGLFKRFVMRRNSDRKDRAENQQISLTGTDSE
ncbi:MAG: 1-deoxy-D-xylulose-5-phosphate synthase [candidate division Zixibacteria bacterium]|nr:1-deoxy-D-xylulose-5-phosphate synthase [candidate division Zixibacteria bacterium]